MRALQGEDDGDKVGWSGLELLLFYYWFGLIY